MVLEVGSGINHFQRGNVFIDNIASPKVAKERMVLSDVAEHPLPFPDKKFDFVYCRHVLEDMYNPFVTMREMQRVGKAGYIETPSPIVECCRGVDVYSPPYRGFAHHRWLIYVGDDGKLTFLPKFNVIEHMNMPDDVLIKSLRHNAGYWNTTYFWDNTIDYDLVENRPDYGMPVRYGVHIQTAVNAAIARNTAFIATINARETHAA